MCPWTSAWESVSKTLRKSYLSADKRLLSRKKSPTIGLLRQTTGLQLIRKGSQLWPAHFNFAKGVFKLWKHCHPQQAAAFCMSMGWMASVWSMNLCSSNLWCGQFIPTTKFIHATIQTHTRLLLQLGTWLKMALEPSSTSQQLRYYLHPGKLQCYPFFTSTCSVLCEKTVGDHWPVTTDNMRNDLKQLWICFRVL